MKTYKIAYFSSSGNDLSNLNSAITEMQRSGHDIKCHARTKDQFFDENSIDSFVKNAMNSDIVYIGLHGAEDSFPASDKFFGEIDRCKNEGRETPYVHIQSSGPGMVVADICGKYSSSFNTENWIKICEYSDNGGVTNIRNMFCYMFNILGNKYIEYSPVIKTAEQGIYHPDLDCIPEPEEYYEKFIKKDQPVIGLWFHNTFWKNSNLDNIDKIIREIEKQGTGVVAVFLNRNGDKIEGGMGPDSVIDSFFMENGKSRIDLLLNSLSFSMNLLRPDLKGMFENLGVPVLQVMNGRNSYEEWKESEQGVTVIDVMASAALPEFDGVIINMNTGTRESDIIDKNSGALISRNVGMPERIEKLVSFSLNWIRLSKKKNKDKKVAIIFHHYPPRNDRIGCAMGLDSFASIKNLIDRLKEEGYNVDRTYENGDALSSDMLSRMTYDKRYVIPETMAEKSEAWAEREVYIPWHEKLPYEVREHMVKHWGQMPGEVFVHDDTLNFAGVHNGNLFITMQPPRGEMEKLDELMHDTDLCPTHHYLAKYRWIKNIFRADAVIHVGTHGSLEWLPGKALGLSEECYPDLSIMDLPNIYYYIISNPGEGMQAKRRSYCCIIDHLTPPMTNSKLYDELTDLENTIKNYYDAKFNNQTQMGTAGEQIWEAVVKANLDKDMNLTQDIFQKNLVSSVEKIHGYLEDISDTMISDGLHTIGEHPEGSKLVEFIVQLTRIDNDEAPSLRESVIYAMGYDYDELIENKGKILSHYKRKTGGQIISLAHEKCVSIVQALSDKNFDAGSIPEIINEFFGRDIPAIKKSMEYICSRLYSNILRTREEIDSTLAALDGKYVEPGPSGAPTRGEADILPTGKNFYSVDPSKIPTKVAWDTGVKLGDSLIEKYEGETGSELRTVAFFMTSTSVMRSKGETLAEILYLLGVKPVWDSVGKVTDLEIIPLEELKRPRYDVMTRASGSFRDAFPNLMDLMNDAVAMVVALDEPPESNILKQNVYSDIQKYTVSGMSQDEAMNEATFRVFSSPPGTYGAGVKELVECSVWNDSFELGNMFINWSSYGYKNGEYGALKTGAFKNLLSRTDATVQNNDSREYDMFSCTDYYNYYGGLISAVKTVKGEFPFSVYGDSSDPSHVKNRTLDEESKQLFRAKIFNPKYIDGLKKHGYKGAGDLSKIVDIVFGWDATAEIVDDFLYDMLSEKYALNPEMREWMKEVNPYALQNIVSKLLEASARGMWETSDERINELQNIFLEMEGEIEDVIE